MFQFISKALATLVLGMNSLMCVTPLTTENFYCDTFYDEQGTSYVQTTEQIYFDHYTLTEFYIPTLVPLYENYTQVNSCAPMAGTIVVGYYDLYYPNIVPNYETALFDSSGNFVDFKNNTSDMLDIKEELYDLMGTNSIQSGTSISQFKTGLTSYVNTNGQSIAYNDLGTFSVSGLQSYINLNRPVVLFINSYVYITSIGFTETDEYLGLVVRTATVGHVCVAFGYQKYDFYDSSNTYLQTEEYILVSFGDGDYGFLRINNGTTDCIDTAYAINIF